MSNDKCLRNMSMEEIAALNPQQFQELAHDHNDHLELRENAHQRQLEEELQEHKESGVVLTHMIDDHEEALPNRDKEVDEMLQGLLEDRPSEPTPSADRDPWCKPWSAP